MIGYRVISFDDAELEWLFEDPAEALEEHQRQFLLTGNVGIMTETFVSLVSFEAERARCDRQRNEYADEVYYQRYGAA